VGDVVVGEGAALAVLEPLLQDLVAADVERTLIIAPFGAYAKGLDCDRIVPPTDPGGTVSQHFGQAPFLALVTVRRLVPIWLTTYHSCDIIARAQQP